MSWLAGANTLKKRLDFMKVRKRSWHDPSLLTLPDQRSSPYVPPQTLEVVCRHDLASDDSLEICVDLRAQSANEIVDSIAAAVRTHVFMEYSELRVR
jgi:hypothetical protein